MPELGRRHLEAVVRDSEGRSVARCLLQRGRYVIGQERVNEIVIDDASVSRRHARLTVVDDQELYLEDLESANGTLVDDEPVAGMTRIELGARIRIGLCTLDFQRAGLPAVVYRHLPDGFLREHRYNIGDPVIEGRT